MSLPQKYASMNDNMSQVSKNSQSTFSERNFCLPELEQGTSHFMTKDELLDYKYEKKKDSLQTKMIHERNLLTSLDHKSMSRSCAYSPVKTVNVLKLNKVKKDANKELQIIKHIINRKAGDLKEEINTMKLDDFLDADGNVIEEVPGNMDVSVIEKLNDLLEEDTEHWLEKRRKPNTARYTNEEKRKLRKWFNELDYDGSGEVSVDELQDPLISSGILKTKQQVIRVMANVDKNNTNGIDFEEFLQALSSNKIADAKNLRKLQEMSNNADGFSMDTMLTAARRKTLYHSVVNKCDKRQHEMDKLMKKFDDRQRVVKKDTILQQIDALDEKQNKSNYLHKKYIAALSGVIEDRKAFYNVTADDIKKCAEEEEKRIYSSQEALKFHGMFSNRHPTGLLNTAIYEVVDKSIKDLYEKRQTYLDEKGTVTGKDKRNSSLDNKFSIYS